MFQQRVALMSMLAVAAAGIAVQADRAGEVPDGSSVASSSVGAAGTVYNLKIVSDASPDLTDLNSFVDSATSRWNSTEGKVWALFYWSHILKRQTSPMVLHGFEVTDPIRNLVDYGFTMCSTVSGINQSLYEALGLRHQVLGHLQPHRVRGRVRRQVPHDRQFDVESRDHRRWRDARQRRRSSGQ